MVLELITKKREEWRAQGKLEDCDFKYARGDPTCFGAEADHYIGYFFPDLPVSMLSLTKFIFLDDAGKIYIALYNVDWTTLPFFLCFIMVV